MSALLAYLKAAGKSLDDLEDLLVFELCDLYDAQEQIIRALPRMINAAANPALKSAFQNHVAQTRVQKQRLEQVFQSMGKEAKRQSCEGIRGIIAETAVVCNIDGDPNVKDAALISCAQRIEHYEMAAYGSCRTFAQVLGFTQASALLQQTLDEEGDTDHELTALALSGLNLAAVAQK